MPGFCVSCGAPLTGPFCNTCGARAVSPGAPPQPRPAPPSPTPVPPTVASAAPSAFPPARPPAAAPVKSSGLGKALVITGVVLLVLFVVGVAGALYGFYWLKHKVSTYTAVVSGESSAQVKVAQGHSCVLLSTEELQQVLGVAVERTSEIMEGSDPGCAYYANPDAFAHLQRAAVEQARRDSEKAAKQPEPKTDNPLELLKDANQLEGVMKSLGLSQPDKEGRVFSFTVQRDFGRDNWSTLRATMSVVPGFEEMTGVGDRAMMGSFGHAIYVLKGDSVIHLELTYVPDARTRGGEIARKIVSHL
jgi:hypothetical protein